MNKLNIQPSECNCKKCSEMCYSPCCGTPEEMDRLIKMGFGDRLMLDDLPGGATMLKPALKGYEGKQAPWETQSKKGCTFWKDGLCELHDLGCKPLLGKLAHHDLSDEKYNQIADFLDESWQTEIAEEIIEIWKEIIIHKFVYGRQNGKQKE